MQSEKPLKPLEKQLPDRDIPAGKMKSQGNW
jgi:hypothetical protein